MFARRRPHAVIRAGALSLALASVVMSAAPAAQPSTTPSQARRATPDATLVTRVRAALLSASDVPGRDIAVVAAGGIVTVSGVVRSTNELQSLGAVVRAVPGVRDVRFSIRVQPPPPQTPPGR